MKAIIAIIAVLLIGVLMLNGCFGPDQTLTPDTNTIKVTNEDEAQKTLTDASSDISGVASSLDELDGELAGK
ncbi:MAG: hypothetical protein AABW59_05520 [archaeon]|mgnify:CR=1 FL=1